MIYLEFNIKFHLIISYKICLDKVDLSKIIESQSLFLIYKNTKSQSVCSFKHYV
jgi:hypothetical protein